MTTDVAPISDAELERYRPILGRGYQLPVVTTRALIARLDEAETKVSKLNTQINKVYENLNELRITNSEEILALEVERDRLVALNAELIAKHKKVIAWLERLAASAETAVDSEKRFLSLRDARLADAKNYRATAADIRAVLPKARPQEPVP